MVKNRILITGGAGFIGSNLVHHINRTSPDSEVVVLDDLSTGLRQNIDSSRQEFHHGSILDYAKLRKSAVGVDSIVHLAAIGSVPKSVAAPRPTHDANTTGTLNVLEVARELDIPYVVVASSSSVYGQNPSLPKDELDWTRPMSPYAVSKLATESYALAYGFSYGIDTLALRFFNVYGPGQRADHDYAAVIPKFLTAALEGRKLTIHGDGTQSRDFTYVQTVCEALLHAVEKRVSSETPINLAFGTNTTLLKLVDIIRTQVGKELEIEYLSPRTGDVKASQANPERMRGLFSELAPTSLDAGVKHTLHWLREKSIDHNG